jgi:hypothetical protein
VADGRRLRELERANKILERSVSSYQNEREQIRAAYEKLKDELRSPSGVATSLNRDDQVRKSASRDDEKINP